MFIFLSWCIAPEWIGFDDHFGVDFVGLREQAKFPEKRSIKNKKIDLTIKSKYVLLRHKIVYSNTQNG